jgi:hypothetical protein
MKYYIYKPSNGGRLKYVGTLCAATPKKLKRLVRTTYPKLKVWDALFAAYVTDKATGAVKLPPWKGKAP